MNSTHRRNAPFVIDLVRTDRGFQVVEIPKNGNKKLINIQKARARNAFNDRDPMHKTDHDEDSVEGLSHPSGLYRRNAPYQSNDQVPQQGKEEARSEVSEVPLRPEWFHTGQTHEREKSSLPDFFEGNHWKTPALYMKYRNFIVNTYERNPSVYFGKIACRRILRGDAGAIVRIHQFLENEGIINIGRTLQSNSSFEPKPYLNIPPRQSFTSLPPWTVEALPSKHPKDNIQFDFKPNFTSKILAKTGRGLCSTCTLPLGVVWFQSKQRPETYVCIKCFNDLPALSREQLQKQDIIKNPIEMKGKNKWQMEEHGQLLSVLSSSNSTWDQVFEKIPNKSSQEEVIFHYIQLPAANINTLVPPQQLISKNNLGRYTQMACNNFHNSPISVVEEPNTQASQLDPKIAELVSLRLKKLFTRLEALKKRDETNYCASIHVNPVEVVARMRMVRGYGGKVEEKREEVELDEPQELIIDDDHFFNNDFDNNNLDNFDVDESRGEYGGIFDGLNN